MSDIDLDMLAYDIADMLDRNEYPVDADADDVRPRSQRFSPTCGVLQPARQPDDRPGHHRRGCLPGSHDRA
jgi:hypothetical protein